MSKIQLNDAEHLIVDEIKDELSEDLSRWDNDGESWLETALDCPSNTFEELQGQLIHLVGDERHALIMEQVILPYMRKIANT